MKPSKIKSRRYAVALGGIIVLLFTHRALSASRMDLDTLEPELALSAFEMDLPGHDDLTIGHLRRVRVTVDDARASGESDDEPGWLVPEREARPAPAPIREKSVRKLPARKAKPAAKKIAAAKKKKKPHDRIVWPVVKGRISSGFGFRRHPISRCVRFHRGVDIAAPQGSPIHAARAGVVIFSGRRGGYGFCVDIRHADGSITRYAHNQANVVRQGARVKAGQRIAKVGTSGHSTGPHVHVEYIKGNRHKNPLSYL